MKKILSTVLVLVLTIALLAGCAGTAGSSGTTGSQAAGTTAAGTAATTAAGKGKTFAPDDNFNATGYPIAKKPVTFSVLAANDSSMASDWNTYTAQKYWSQYTNINFKFDYISLTDWNTQINLKLSAGTLPDLIKSPLDTPILQTHGVEGGKFLNYADYYKTYMPNMAKAFEKYPEIKAFSTMSDNAIYELVQYIWTYTMANPIYYRNDMLTELGAQVPKTVDDFYALLVKARDHYSNVQGFYPLISAITWLHQDLFPAFGKAWQYGFGDNGDGKVTYNCMGDQWRHYLEFVAKLYSEKLIDKEVFTMDNATVNSKIKAGQCMVIGNNGTQLTANYFKSGKIETKILPPLVSKYDSTQKVVSIPTCSWCGCIISKSCKSPQYLMRYFDMFFTEPKDVFDGICGLSSWLGIKGTDWDFSADGKNYYRILPKDTFGLSEEEYKNKYVYGGGYTGLVILDKFPINNPTQEMKASESAASYYPYMKDRLYDAQFKYSADENSTLTGLITDINTYVDTSTAQFINGTVQLNDTTWNKYLDDLKKMGIDKVLTIKQAGYDRWKTATKG